MSKKLIILVILVLCSLPAFAQNVDTAWVRRFNGSGNDWDEAYDIAIDNSGYVYVTGYTSGSGTLYDYTTIKYDPKGDTAW
ncbi:MAG: SBBP repeat-containing protein, partial [candidate division Zixibacteria bacterium]|nr:SBBP repeat-containing protein [candidate division Zixibacteria bacterium]